MQPLRALQLTGRFALAKAAQASSLGCHSFLTGTSWGSGEKIGDMIEDLIWRDVMGHDLT